MHHYECTRVEGRKRAWRIRCVQCSSVPVICTSEAQVVTYMTLGHDAAAAINYPALRVAS